MQHFASAWLAMMTRQNRHEKRINQVTQGQFRPAVATPTHSGVQLPRVMTTSSASNSSMGVGCVRAFVSGSIGGRSTRASRATPIAGRRHRGPRVA
eukprot:scaffold99868_cov30-Tisochrysis_lutea.AAC.4